MLSKKNAPDSSSPISRDLHLLVDAGEAAIIFDHLAGQNVEGASIFWIRRQAAIGGEQAAVEHWQLKRDKTRRGIVEVINDDSERSRT